MLQQKLHTTILYKALRSKVQKQQALGRLDCWTASNCTFISRLMPTPARNHGTKFSGKM